MHPPCPVRCSLSVLRSLQRPLSSAMSSSMTAAPLLLSTASFPAPSSSLSAPLVLKVRCVSSGDCRRFPLPVSPPLSFPALLSCVSSLFSLPVSRIELQWCDDERDMVTVASEAEWQRLQRDARDRQQKVLQLSVVENGATQRPHTQQPRPQPEQWQQQGNKQAASAYSDVGRATAPSAGQRDGHADLGQQSVSAPSFYPSLAQSAKQFSDELDALREEKQLGPEQQPLQPSVQPPSQPSSTEHVYQLAVSSEAAVQTSSAVSSDEESPVLIDGSNLPSASDSHAASALWKRHKYKAQQSLRQRRDSHSSAQAKHPVPDTASFAPTLSLDNARSNTASRSRQQSTLTPASSLSLPSSPLSRSPPASAHSPSALSTTLSQHLERARLQLKHLLPASLSSSSSSSSLGSRSAVKLSASIASEQERNERIAAAYDLLTSFIVDGGIDEYESVSRDEILSRCIALFVYNEKYLSDKKRRNDELAAQLGGVDMNRRDEEDVEADKRRQLLNEAQRHGLRSLSSSVPISASCSPALVTVMAIIHRYLHSRVVTDVPATLELFAAVLADLTAQVQREENRENALMQLQAQQSDQQAGKEETKEPMLHPFVGSQSDVSSDDELLAHLSRLPAPLRDSVRALLGDCVHYASAAVEANRGVAFSSLSSHSFSATLHTFRTDLQDVVSDELLRLSSVPCSTQQAASAAHEQGEHDQDAKLHGLDHSIHQPQQPTSGDVHSLSQPSQQAALFDVGRDDVMLSDRKIMKAVAKAIKKEQKEQRKERKAEKRLRKASRGKSDLNAALQQPIDYEEHELHELLNQMNNTRQQQPIPPLGGDTLAASAATLGGDGWQLYPQAPAASASPADASSPFAFQPFPYTLSSKQQQQQQPPAGRVAQQDRLPAASSALSTPQIAVAADPLSGVSYPTPPSDIAHFPALPFAVAPSGYATAAIPVAAPPMVPSVPPPSFASVVSSYCPPAGPASPVASGDGAASRRLSSLLESLHVMGFTDDSLNTWLLQRNGYDLNQTVEWLIVQAEVGLD